MSPLTHHHELRAAALAADALGQRWQSLPLHPWTARRDQLYLALRSAFFASGELTAAYSVDLGSLPANEEKARALLASKQLDVPLTQIIDYTAYLHDAAIVLWLATSTPETIQQHRGDLPALFAQVDAFIEAHIPLDQITAAVQLAHRVRHAHRAFEVVPQPQKAIVGGDLGNSPSREAKDGLTTTSPSPSPAAPSMKGIGTSPSSAPTTPSTLITSPPATPCSGPIPASPPPAADSSPSATPSPMAL